MIAYAEELFNQAVLTENFLKNYRSNNLSIGIAGGLILSFASLIDHFKEIHPSIKISLREKHRLKSWLKNCSAANMIFALPAPCLYIAIS